jgi:hypothetical protein
VLRYKFPIVLILLAAGAPAIWAQDQGSQNQNQSNSPIPAYHSPLASAADSTEDTVPVASDLAPDARSVTGVQDLSLGAPKTGHSYWQPHVDANASFYSNFLNPTTNTGWSTWGSVSGGVDLHRISGNSNLTLTYLGIASLSNDGGTTNGIVQQLQVLDRFNFRRYALTVADQVSYLPNGGFGYGGIGSTPYDTGNLGLQTGLTPVQSILTSQGQSLTNTALAEVDTYLTPRASLTFYGSYGLLRYFDNNLLDTTVGIFQVGYNYQLTRADTIAFSYGFDAFRYSSGTQSINDHSFQFHYARRVTGRLAFQIAGGPSIAFSNFAISGNSTPVSGGGSAGTPTNATQVFWVLNAGATYQWRRVTLTASYDHGVTGGSGVLAGAISDIATGTVSKQLTRNLNASCAVGYSRNSGLALPTTSNPNATGTNQTYDYWFGGVNVSRAWGRSMRLNFGYQVQYQTSDMPFCITTPCSTSYLLNQITFGVGWHPGPKAY